MTSAIDPRPTLAAPDDDPHLWLEEIEGPRAVAWVEQQNDRTLQAFGGPAVEQDATTLATIFDRPDKIAFPGRRAGWLYNFWTDAAYPRGLWRRTSPESYRREQPDWEILIDLDALAKAEGEDWIWGGATTRPPAHDRALVRLSRGGSDAAVLREFDIATRAFVPDGFVVPEAKGGASWLDDDTLILSSAYGGDVTTSGYSRTVKLWRRATPPEEATVLFAVPATHMSAGGGLDRTDPEKPIWFNDQIGFFDLEIWRGKQKLDLPTGVQIDSHRGWLAVKPRQAWTVGGRTWPGDSLLGIHLHAFLAGSRDFALLFEPGPRRVLERFSWHAGRLILSISDNLDPVFEVLDPDEGAWTRTTLIGLPRIGVVDVWALDVERTEADGTMLASAQDPLTPSSLMLLAPGKSPEILKRAPAVFTADGLVVTRHEAASVDGERIPYVQTGPAGETGDAPVYMTGYGGFGIASRPYYNASVGKLWLERGGTSVVANIRGGGEFGVPWHDAGRGAGKRLSHDDFAAVAADLVRRGVTRPGRIAAEGGSNGGILIANMMTRYPDRFGALLCTIPLIDMRRYSKLL
ncbi:MAG TPA: prolyl oligopeptidase family serine peptidase, partial [Reyranella sp.]|nr:prolyl oligopeptidase family serine peptidase [Reyranella sp.]